MQCPACGKEKYRVCKQPTRGIRSEVRIVECVGCETKFTLVNGVESIRVLNPHATNRFDLPIDQFDERWMDYVLGRGKYPGKGDEC